MKSTNCITDPSLPRVHRYPTVYVISTQLLFLDGADKLLYLLNNLVYPVRLADDVVLMIHQLRYTSYGGGIALTIPADFLQNERYKRQLEYQIVSPTEYVLTSRPVARL